MGGGSSNAASVMLIINRLWKMGLSTKQLMQMAEKIGADVPFFIVGGIKKVGGIGQYIRPMESNLKFIRPFIVIPKTPISTANAYGKLDALDLSRATYTNEIKYKNLIIGLRQQNIDVVAENIYNKFEIPAFDENPELVEIKNAIESIGALRGFMTGSGSTMVGLARTEEDRTHCIDELILQGYNAMSIELVPARRWIGREV